MNEKAVQQAVKNYFSLRGFKVSDLSQPRATMQTPGLPDLYLQHKDWGLTAWVEVKTPTGVMSAAQIEWADNEIESGGMYYVVKSVEEAQQLVEHLRGRGPVDRCNERRLFLSILEGETPTDGSAPNRLRGR